MVFVMLAGIVLLLALVNYYIMKRLYPLVKKYFPKLSMRVYCIICYVIIGIMALGTSKGLMPVPDNIKTIICAMSSRWLGLFVYLLMYFVISDVILLIGIALKRVPKKIPNKIRVTVGIIVLTAAVATVVFGELHANKVYLKSYEVDVDSDSLNDGMTIVLVSDIHLGASGSERRLPKIIERINEQNADVVCIAGDIFDNDFNGIDHPDEVKKQLLGIKSKYGVYASLGNHDTGDTINEMLSFLDECNITLLKDEYAVVGDKINIVGRVDGETMSGAKTIERKDYASILKSIDNNLPIVVMEHEPSKTEEYGKETSLVLSGHTHDGQIFPGNLIVRYLNGEKAYGYSILNGVSQIIVSSGAGTWGMPMRVGTNCEVVNITLK